MSQVQYGNFLFENPQPLVVFAEEPVYIKGKLDHFVDKITLIGNITGSNLQDLAVKKRSLLTGLSSSYASLVFDEKTFPCAKPSTIQFSESQLTSLLPFSIEMESYTDSDFSNFFGVKDPADSWAYTEEEGRIVKASHSVSAVGVKTGEFSDPLLTARNFVSGRLNGFENISNFFSGDSGFLISRNEEVDRSANRYSITEEYSFDAGTAFKNNKGVLTTNIRSSYSKEEGLQASLDGSLIGPMGSFTLSTGDFTPQDAKQIVTKYIEESKSAFESGVYNHIIYGPSSYKYDINELANTINFSFDFKDPDKFSEFNKEITVAVNASKDSSVITIDINGSISYKGTDHAFFGDNIEESVRWQKVEEEFEKLDLYAEALSSYLDFCSEFPEYDDGGFIATEPRSASVTKNPFEASVSFNYSYSNDRQLFANIRNATVSFTDTKPLVLDSVQEATIGFAIQEEVVEKIGTLSVDASCEENGSRLNDFKSEVESLFTSKICVFDSKNYTTGDNKIDYSFNSFYSS